MLSNYNYTSEITENATYYVFDDIDICCHQQIIVTLSSYYHDIAKFVTTRSIYEIITINLGIEHIL